MRISQSNSLAAHSDHGRNPRGGGTNSHVRQPGAMEHNGYADREMGTGYGRSSGYSALDGYRGRSYARSESSPLFRFI